MAINPSEANVDRETQKPHRGGYRKVLEHPEHTAGVAYGTLAVTATRPIGVSMVRVRGTLDHPEPTASWQGTNLAIRLEIPGATDDDPVVSRVYTVQSCSPGDGVTELEFDVVLHEGRSPMMSWVHTVRPGDHVRILGPRQHFLPLHIPGRPVALFADETAIPALGTIIRDWPNDSRGFAWVESADPEAVRTLPERPEVDLVWLRREPDREPGTTGQLVQAARTSLESTGSVPTVWAAGEQGEMRALRQHFRTDTGLPKDDVQVFGYWRRALSSTEIDRRRLERYEQELRRTGTFTVLDEFEDPGFTS